MKSNAQKAARDIFFINFSINGTKNKKNTGKAQKGFYGTQERLICIPRYT